MARVVLAHPISQFILAVTGIFLIGSLPFLFFDIERLLKTQALLDSGKLRNTLFLYQPVSLYVDDYINGIRWTLDGLIDPKWKDYLDYRSIEKPLYPLFTELYIKTIKYLGISTVVSFSLSIIFTYVIMLCNKRVKKGVNFFFFMIESLPDLFVILGLQFFVVWFFKKTNILLFNFVSTFGDEALLLPLLVLSFLPTIYMTRYLLLSFEDETQLPYVELAKGKGLNSTEILMKHIFRNAFASFIFHFKTIFWFTLSNLLMVEIVLNVNGFLRFIWENCARNPELLTLGMLFIFVPFFCIMTFLKMIANRLSMQGSVK